MTTRSRRVLKRMQNRAQRSIYESMKDYAASHADKWDPKEWNQGRQYFYAQMMELEENKNPPELELSEYKNIKKIDDDPNWFYSDSGHDVVLKDGSDWFISPDSFTNQLIKVFESLEFVRIEYCNPMYPYQIWLVFRLKGLPDVGEIQVIYDTRSNMATSIHEEIEFFYSQMLEKLGIKVGQYGWAIPTFKSDYIKPDSYNAVVNEELQKSQGQAREQIRQWVDQIEFEKISWGTEERDHEFHFMFKWPEMGEGIVDPADYFKLEDVQRQLGVWDLVEEIIYLFTVYLGVHHLKVDDPNLRFSEAEVPNFYKKMEPTLAFFKKESHRREVKRNLRSWLKPAVREFPIEDIHAMIDEVTVDFVMEE